MKAMGRNTKRTSEAPRADAGPSTAEPPFAVPSWPATTPKLLPLREIIPYPRNPRTHPPAQIELLATLMKRHGVDQPIVVDEENVILKGHGRLAAAELAGFETFPVVRHVGLSETEKIAVRLADNQVGLLSGWDSALMTNELGGLKIAGFDLPLLGFAESQLTAWGILLGTEGQQSAEVAPEPPKHPIVRVGDLWTLGDHRILCGDATSADDVSRLLGKSKPHLMVTDPPYGVEYDPNWRNGAAAKGYITYAPTRVGVVHNDNRLDWKEAWKLFSGDVVYVWHAGRHANAVQASLEVSGLFVRSQIIWAKSNYSISRGDYHWQHEPCWYAVRKGKTSHWQGARNQATLWKIDLDRNVEGGHSTQKPLECMKRPIENNSKSGDAVYDPFVGSGTTIVAAEMMRRKALAIEIDPSYCQVSIERWQAFTGREATLDGKTFTEVQRERQKRGRQRAAPASAGKEVQTAQ